MISNEPLHRQRKQLRTCIALLAPLYAGLSLAAIWWLSDHRRVQPPMEITVTAVVVIAVVMLISAWALPYVLLPSLEPPMPRRGAAEGNDEARRWQRWSETLVEGRRHFRFLLLASVLLAYGSLPAMNIVGALITAVLPGPTKRLTIPTALSALSLVLPGMLFLGWGAVLWWRSHREMQELQRMLGRMG